MKSNKVKSFLLATFLGTLTPAALAVPQLSSLLATTLLKKECASEIGNLKKSLNFISSSIYKSYNCNRIIDSIKKQSEEEIKLIINNKIRTSPMISLHEKDLEKIEKFSNDLIDQTYFLSKSLPNQLEEANNLVKHFWTAIITGLPPAPKEYATDIFLDNEEDYTHAQSAIQSMADSGIESALTL